MLNDIMLSIKIKRTIVIKPMRVLINTMKIIKRRSVLINENILRNIMKKLKNTGNSTARLIEKN